MTAMSVHSIVMAQTKLECFGAFPVYISTVSNVNITFGTFSLSAAKAAFTLVTVFMPSLVIARALSLLS